MAASEILFVHNNFPGQFGFLVKALLERGVRCAAVSSPAGAPIEGVTQERWKAKRGPTPGIFPDAIRAEADFIRGHAALEAAERLRDQGSNPGLIIGHSGWGETLYLNEIFPGARQIIYGEFYYHPVGVDLDFDPEFGENSLPERLRVHAKNVTMLLALSEADCIVSPTKFQAGLFPSVLHPRIRTIHEGVDTDFVKPNPQAKFRLPNGRVLSSDTRVITFINRCFEPLRGYHIFMRALPAVVAALPDLEIILIGADQPGGYGRPPPRGTSWRELFLDEVRGKLDLSRLHFVGRVPYEQMLAALSISSAHVYYTYPFVLSWSLLEAMACGCLVITSNTPPVREVVQHQINGLSLDFFDVTGLASALVEACNNPSRFAPYRRRARETIIANFDRKRRAVPAWLALIDELIS